MKTTDPKPISEQDLYNKIAKDGLLVYAFTIVNEDEEVFKSHLIPKQVTDGLIFICLQGSVEFFLDLKSYKLKANDMCLTFPFSILQTVHKSDDFRGYMLAVNIELIKEIQIPSSIDYYLYIKDNPCISLSDEKREMLLGLFELMIQKYNEANHPFRQEIAKSLFRAIYYDIAAIYKNGDPITQEFVLRKDMIVRRFFFLLAKNYHLQREVDYYAAEMCITPRYLSTIIKEKTRLNASQWINDMVIKQAKSLLTDKRLSVAQIADELHFANPSFFGKYFKKHTGMPPKKYRDEHI